MCLAVPVRIQSLTDTGRAVIELGGVRREVDLSLLDHAAPGDYVLVHAGFAIDRIQEDEAQKTLDMLREMIDE